MHSSNISPSSFEQDNPLPLGEISTHEEKSTCPIFLPGVQTIVFFFLYFSYSGKAHICGFGSREREKKAKMGGCKSSSSSANSHSEEREKTLQSELRGQEVATDVAKISTLGKKPCAKIQIPSFTRRLTKCPSKKLVRKIFFSLPPLPLVMAPPPPRISQTERIGMMGWGGIIEKGGRNHSSSRFPLPHLMTGGNRLRYIEVSG